MIQDEFQNHIDILLMSKYIKDVRDFYDSEQYLLSLNDMDNMEDKDKIYAVLNKYIEILSSFGIHIHFEHIFIYNIYRELLIKILNILTPGYINEILENSITDIRDTLRNIIEDDISDDEDDLNENIVLNLIEFLSSIKITDDIFTDIVSNIEVDDNYIELIKEVINNSVDVQETDINNKKNQIIYLKNTIHDIYSINLFTGKKFTNIYYRDVVNKIVKFFTVNHLDIYTEIKGGAGILNIKKILRTLIEENALPLSISYFIENNIVKINKYQLLLIMMTDRYLNSKWNPNSAVRNDIEKGIDDLIKHVVDAPDYIKYKLEENDGIGDILTRQIGDT